MDQLDISLSAVIEDSCYTSDEIAQRLGIGPMIFRHKLNPNTDNNRLSLRETIRLVNITSDPRPFETIANMLGFHLVANDDHEPADIVSSVLHTAAEHGDVARTIHDALRDGVITTREHGAIRAEIKEARDALNQLEEAVAAASKGDVINLEQRS